MKSRTIAPQEVLADRSHQPPEIIDVRTAVEFREVHIAGARNVALEALDPGAIMASRSGPQEAPVFLVCKSGARAAKACEKFSAAGFDNVFSIEGGTVAWERAGLPIVRGKNVISLERQVRIATGALVVLGTALGVGVHPGFFVLPAIIGAGLLFAGVTDWCGLAMLLAKMPWNKSEDMAKGSGVSCHHAS